ncbi:MAG: 50S ribosomal protein L18e [Nanoarchaeota archaeon]|nr:50S ribosomal protein L18e [Nanoarchaeota archaeon]
MKQRKNNGTTNPELKSLIEDLKKLSLDEGAPIWKRIAKDLSKPTRQRRVVNIAKLGRFTKENEIIIVPGKVLGTGDVPHNLTVAAWQFSDSAKGKIKTCITIRELMKKQPKGKSVRILG